MPRTVHRARNAVGLAAGFAAEDGVDLGSDHVLRGLIQEGEGVAARALAHQASRERVLCRHILGLAPDVDQSPLQYRPAVR